MCTEENFWMLSSPSVGLLLIYHLSIPNHPYSLCSVLFHFTCHLPGKESQVNRRIKIHSKKRKKIPLRWLLHKEPFRLNFRKLKMSNYMICTTLSRLDFFQSPTEELPHWLRDLSHLGGLRMQPRSSTSLFCIFNTHEFFHTLRWLPSPGVDKHFL